MNILVIDDDVTLLWSLCGMLRRWGSAVEAATGARAGVRMLKQAAFDAVILDYRMPDHDGVWFMRNAAIPDETQVIVMSAYVEPQVLSKMRRLGAGHVLEKPFSETDLRAALASVPVEATWRQHVRKRNERKEHSKTVIARAAHAVNPSERPHPPMECGRSACSLRRRANEHTGIL